MCRLLKKYCVVFMLLFVMLMAGCESSEEELREIPEEEFCETAEEPDDKGVTGESEEIIYVHICGAVRNPGVYELKAGSRIYEALELAGGMTNDAAENSMNQAELLSDGQQLYVMSEEEKDTMNTKNGTTEDGKININYASKEELMTLSGIGESKADSIIRYREEAGKFDSIEEIMEIEGIKEGVFRKIQDAITVS